MDWTLDFFFAKDEVQLGLAQRRQRTAHTEQPNADKARCAGT